MSNYPDGLPDADEDGRPAARPTSESIALASLLVEHRPQYWSALTTSADHIVQCACGAAQPSPVPGARWWGEHVRGVLAAQMLADEMTDRDRLVVAVRDAHQQGPMLVSCCPRCRKTTGPQCGHPWHSGSGSWGCHCGWEQDAPHAEHVADMIERALFTYDQQHGDADEPPVEPFVAAMEFLHGQGVPRPGRTVTRVGDLDLDGHVRRVERIEGLTEGWGTDPDAPPTPPTPRIDRAPSTLTVHGPWDPTAAAILGQLAALPAAVIVNGVRFTPDSPTPPSGVRAHARRVIAEARMIARWLGTLPHRQNHTKENRTDA